MTPENLSSTKSIHLLLTCIWFKHHVMFSYEKQNVTVSPLLTRSYNFKMLVLLLKGVQMKV